MVLSTTFALAQRHERRGREGIITTTQTTCTLANNASGKKNEQRLYIARHNVGAAQYVVEVVVLIKRNGIINNFCARINSLEREMNITREGNGHRKNCLDAQCHLERAVPLP